MNKYKESFNNIKMAMEDGCYDSVFHKDDIDNITDLVERATPKKVFKEQMLDYYDSDNGCKSFEYENVKCDKCNALLTTENDRYDCWINPVKLKDLKFCPNCGQALDWSE